MEAALHKLEAELQSEDLKVRDRAATEAGDLLELHFRPVETVNMTDYYHKVIRPDLLSRPMTEEEERSLIASLGEVFSRSTHDPPQDAASVVAAIGRAKPWIASPILVDALLSNPASFSENELHQLVHGLDQFLFRTHGHPEYAKVRRSLMHPGVKAALEEVTSLSPSHDNACMSQDARRVLVHLGDRPVA